MAGLACTNDIVVRGFLLAACVAGDGVGYTLGVFKDALNTPEASTGKDGDLGRCTRSWYVEGRRWNPRAPSATAWLGLPCCGHQQAMKTSAY
jgi:hypothetical protein